MDPGMWLYIDGHMIHDKGVKEINNREKSASSSNGDGQTGQLHLEKL